MLKSITIKGNLVANPELRFSNNGMAIASFRVACSNTRRDEQGNLIEDKNPAFWNVTAWRQDAELTNMLLKRGSQVVVLGDVQDRSYEAKDGTTRYVKEIQAKTVALSFGGEKVAELFGLTGAQGYGQPLQSNPMQQQGWNQQPPAQPAPQQQPAAQPAQQTIGQALQQRQAQQQPVAQQSPWTPPAPPQTNNWDMPPADNPPF